MCEDVRKCTECKEIQPVSEFGKSSRLPDKLKWWCKTCVNKYNNHRNHAIVQDKFEKRYEVGDPAIGFCFCGDYFKQVYYEGNTFTAKTRDKCITCLKAS